MISIIISWIIILILALIYGRVGLYILYKDKYTVLQTGDIYIVFGILIMNVYAQIFSLLGGVGKLAFIVLVLIAVMLSVWGNKQKIWRKWTSSEYGKPRILILILGSLAVLCWTNLVPQHYDTYLYHAQAIHWIEEYGVVPGLGNLHFRLAYNSAFMTLQALFSFKWLLGQSIHTVNGFVTLFMLGYCVLTCLPEKTKNVQASDFLKMACLGYILYDCIHVSSPNSDTWAMLLIFYIVMKWSEFVKSDATESVPYGFLCLLTVYGATVKLSTACWVLLTIYPAIIFIREKKIGEIIKHIIVGLGIGVPYIVRNIIISGYLIYPYWEIDLFNVDWKMLRTVLQGDRQEIIAWGRGNRDVTRIGEPITKWFCEWFASIHVLWRILFLCTIIAIIILIAITTRNIKHWEASNIANIVCMVGMVFWLFTAPLPRYGMAYMLIIISLTLPYVIIQFKEKISGQQKIQCVIKKSVQIFVGGCILVYSMIFIVYTGFYTPQSMPFVLQNDYANRETKQREMEGCLFAVPVLGDQTGYEPFPTVPYEGILEGIELRGEGLKEGFRNPK